MTSAERTEVLVTARLLQATAKFQWLSIGLTLLALISLVLEKSGSLVLIAVAGLGLVVNYYGFRMAFDARLLTDAAAERLTAADLDVALTALSLAKASKGGRSWSERCLGAKRLSIRCGMALAAQLLVAAIFALTR
ncbi:MAG: hypothetical protein ABI718_00940 [Acidobacteriota bacterium]